MFCTRNRPLSSRSRCSSSRSEAWCAWLQFSEVDCNWLELAALFNPVEFSVGITIKDQNPLSDAQSIWTNQTHHQEYCGTPVMSKETLFSKDETHPVPLKKARLVVGAITSRHSAQKGC